MDKQLANLISRAKAAATDNGAPYAVFNLNRIGAPYAVFNLNRIGARMLVVRPAGNVTAADAIVAGPFNPREE